MIAGAALVVAIALIALAMFGDSESYRVKAVFQNAGQLVPGNEVRVGGQPVGDISTSSWTTRRRPWSRSR